MSMTKLTERRLLVDLLAVLFGTSSWIAVNGLWVETPILVNRLPESWQLASYIVVITQLANIGPIAYSLAKMKFTLETVERPAIHLTQLIGLTASLLMAFFWDHTTEVFGQKHSLALLVLTAALATIDCTSSVLYLPYMSHFKSKYLMSYLIGQGFSGLIPSTVAIIQGAGGSPECKNVTTNNVTTLMPVYKDPLFSVGHFFGLLSLMVFVSWSAFFLLDNLKLAKKERVTVDRLKKSDEPMKKVTADSELLVEPVTTRSFFGYLLVQAYVCCLSNGVLPAIQSYSALPYGNSTYHLAVTLATVANPIGCFLAFLVPGKRQKRVIPVMMLLGSVCAVYIIIAAAKSPTPPLVNSMVGHLIIIVAWILFMGSFSLTRATVAQKMRSLSASHRALFFCGVVTQIGSAVGAIVMFVVVNYTRSFVSFQPC